LVAPFHRNNDEIPLTLAPGAWDSGSFQPAPMFRLLDKRDGWRRSRRLRCPPWRCSKNRLDVGRVQSAAPDCCKKWKRAIRCSGKLSWWLKVPTLRKRVAALRPGSAGSGIASRQRCRDEAVHARLICVLLVAVAVTFAGPVGRRRIRKCRRVRHIGCYAESPARWWPSRDSSRGSSERAGCRNRLLWLPPVVPICGKGDAIRRALHFEAGLVGRIVGPREIDLRGAAAVASNPEGAAGRTGKSCGAADVGWRAGIPCSVSGR